MRLYLVRHGEAVPDTVDPSRPLSAQGIKEIAATAGFLKRSGAEIEVFYHSGKTRAQMTAEMIRKEVNPKARLEKKDRLGPEDPVDELAVELERVKENVLIAGHMPYLAYLVCRLLTGDTAKNLAAFSTGSVAVLERDKNKNWILLTLLSPQMLG